MTQPGAGIARALTVKGAIQDEVWHRAVLAVDRDAFVPDTVWVPDDDEPGWERPVTRGDPEFDPLLAGDWALVTQVDDGKPSGPDGRGRVPSSSLSQPSLVVAMLQALDVADGMRVLEIGTGTGYNTALLCERLGADRVTSVEVDPAVAGQAAANLRAAGYKPHLVVGDGAVGVPGRAPFDRVIATVAAKRVPMTWITQTRPGGVIVTPWGPGFDSAALLRLTVSGDGSARGRMVGDAPFMWLRDQRFGAEPWHVHVDEDSPDAVAGTVLVNPRVVTDRHPGWRVVLGQLAPGLGYASFDADPENTAAAGEASVYVYDRAGSWALGEYTPAGPPYESRRAGPRDLWSEIAAAREVWERAGRPARERLGLTVTADGGHVLWLDGPENPIEAPPLL
ncbi:methyltransferase domain-containing protein [Marinactinospora rubrisoli]|uniref:Protein-L-isoaspartate O-methyltransferase n=1 Tax=Marinactinospora rubrisoli TaxID=2715399 RepID=A0ABW2KPM1_9ACTN